MLNVTILTGRLVSDPVVKYTQNNIAVTSFAIAIQRPFSSKQSGERQSDFIDIVAWRSTAEFVSKYFSKGNLISIEGTIQTRTYEDKNGNKRKAVEVVANNVHFVESKASADANRGTAPINDEFSNSFSTGDAEDFVSVDADDDLPF